MKSGYYDGKMFLDGYNLRLLSENCKDCPRLKDKDGDCEGKSSNGCFVYDSLNSKEE